MEPQPEIGFNPYNREFESLAPEEAKARAAHLLWENICMIDREEAYKRRIEDLESRLAVHQRLAQRVREALRALDPVGLEAINAKFFKEACEELGLEKAKSLLLASGCPAPEAPGRVEETAWNKDQLVEHGVVMTVELRVEAETLDLAKEFGEQWLRWNLRNLLTSGEEVIPHSVLAPPDLEDRYRTDERPLGYFHRRARITEDYDCEFDLRLECGGQSAGDSRGKYAEHDWLDSLDERIAFYRNQETERNPAR